MSMVVGRAVALSDKPSDVHPRLAAPQYNAVTIRDLEVLSIRQFVTSTQPYLSTGDVLDFGCGKPGTCRQPQPYRDLVTGNYHPYDIGDRLPSSDYPSQFDTVLCTQVLQYIANPIDQIAEFAALLKIGGFLVMTYPTSWDEVETSDLWRFTKAGMDRLLVDAGFEIVIHERRASITLGGFNFHLGYGVVAKKLKPSFTPNQEESAALLTRAIVERRPFMFLRYGDGMIECMNDTNAGRRTCDGELYTKELGADLQATWATAVKRPGLYVGDWQSASFKPKEKLLRYKPEWRAMIDKQQLSFLHYEALLFMQNRPATKYLAGFWHTVKHDPRRKLIMGPIELSQAARLLGAKHLITPVIPNLHESITTITRQLLIEDFEVLLWGAGMASSIAVVECREKYPDRTYINIGSALDPVFRRRSRTQQMLKDDATKVFHDAVA